MSPNEFQLRSALRDGEGDPLDPDRLIAHAVGVRRDRRRKINTMVAGGAAVAVVGLCASAFIAFGGSDAGSGSAGGAAAGQYDANATSHAASAGGTSAGAAAGPVPAPRASGATSPSGAESSSASSNAPTGAGCPTTADRYSLPGGGRTGGIGSGKPLFSAPVTSIRVCSYPARASYVPGVSTLTGADAQSIVTALEAAPSRPTNAVCPGNVSTEGGTLELIGITSSGRELPGVVITLGCPSSQATNGTAERYPRSLPKDLLRKLFPSPTKSTAGNGSPTK